MRLGGFVRTIPDLSTFVHPVFLDDEGSPILQLIENGIITAWKRYQPDSTLEFFNSNLTAKPGDRSIYGFVFTDDSLVFGERAPLAKALASDNRIGMLAERQPNTFRIVRRFIDESSAHFFSLNGSECIEYPTTLPSSAFAVMLLDALKKAGKNLGHFICFHVPLTPLAQASSGIQSAILRLNDTDELELRWGYGSLKAIPRRSRATPVHLSAFSYSTDRGGVKSILGMDIIEHEISIPFEPSEPFFFMLNSTLKR